MADPTVNLANILDRLQLMHADIKTLLGGNLTVFRLLPRAANQAKEKLPAVYVTPDGYQEILEAHDTAIRTYRLEIAYLIDRVSKDILTTSGESDVITDGTILMDTVTAYYNTHRRLSTNTLESLDYVIYDMVLSNSGIGIGAPFNDPTQYFMTLFTLSVPALIYTE